MGIKQAQAYFAALISWPLAAQDYNPTAIPPQIIGSPQTMTPLNGGDDSTRLVQFAFPFEYYGQTFTQAWVSSNGFVSFGDIGHLCCDGWPIENAPRNTIYGLWSDLISGGNPYYRADANATVFGWYGTQEYGSGLSNTFEIALFPDGKVQWNYGDVNNIYHTVTAGLTGPTMADSISLFYGQNVNLLDNTSYIAGVPSSPPPPPEPEPEPEPVFNPVDIGPSVTPSPVEETVAEVVQEQIVEEQPVVEQAVEETVEEAAAETEAVAETTEEVVEEVVETVQEEAATEEVVVEEEQEAEAEDAERLDPNEVLALAAGGGELSDGSSELTQSEIASSLEAVSESAAQAESAASNEAKAEESKSSGPAASQDKNQVTEVGSTETRRVEDRDGPLDASKTDPEASQAITSTLLRSVDPVASEGSVAASNGPDSNMAFFQREAVEDANTFARETILQVRLQDVAFVANADAQYERMHGAQTTTDTVDTTYELTNVDGPVFAPPPVTGMVSEPTSPSNQAQQMELLNMAGMQGEMSAGPVIDVGDVNSGDNEAMTQLAVAPAGYSAYTQARIPDQPFYQPRDIYKGRRIPDSSMALYRMMRGQDQLWDDMVEDQYE